MKKIIQWFLFIILPFMFHCILAHAQIGPIPEEVFFFGEVKIGSTTFDDIQAKYGKASIIRVGKEEEAAMQICYSPTSPKRKIFIVFETGPMGGFKKVTGFRITTHYQENKSCLATDIDLSALTFGNGVRLLQSREYFLKIFNVRFRQIEDKLVYEGESKREATKEELDKIRKDWPNENQVFFDVVITIRSEFKNNQLVDYYVSKIESY